MITLIVTIRVIIITIITTIIMAVIALKSLEVLAEYYSFLCLVRQVLAGASFGHHRPSAYASRWLLDLRCASRQGYKDNGKEMETI